MNRWFASLILFLEIAFPALAQPVANVVVSDDKTPQTAKLIPLTVRPAAAPRPSLKYSLLPDLLDQTPGNAATLYDTAVQLYTPSRDELKEKVATWVDVPLKDLPREEVRSVLGEYSSALRYVRLAAHRERCAWDLPVRTESFSTLLPSLASLRGLARLLAVKSRLEIVEGRYDDALDTLQTGFAVARHVSEAPTLINGLVGVAIGNLMADRVAEFVQAPGAPNLYWAMTELPRPFIDLREAMQGEAALLYFKLPQLRNIESTELTPRQWQALTDELVGFLAGVTGPDRPRAADWDTKALNVAWAIKTYPAAKQHLLSLGRSPKQVEAMPVQQVVMLFSLDRYTYWRDEMFKWLGLPYAQARQGLEKTDKAFMQRGNDKDQGYPFTMCLPSLSQAYFKTTKLDCQIAALRCVEALRMYAAEHDGKLPASLADVDVVPVPIDPLTGASFGYELAGSKVTLDAPAPSGRSPQDGTRYEITFTR